MLTTPHVLVALTIVQKVPNVFGLLLALLSHFLIDFLIPHWNPHIYTEYKKNGRISLSSLKIIIIDALIAMTALFILSIGGLPNYTLIMLYIMAAFLGILPDIIEIPYYFFGCKSKFVKGYIDFAHNNQPRQGVFWGIATQALVVLATIKQLFF